MKQASLLLLSISIFGALIAAGGGFVEGKKFEPKVLTFKDDKNFSYIFENKKGKSKELGCDHVEKMPKKRCKRKVDGIAIAERCQATCKKYLKKRACDDELFLCPEKLKVCEAKVEELKAHSPEVSFQMNNLITAVEVNRRNITNPYAPEGHLPMIEEASIKAQRCLDVDLLEPDYSHIPDKYWCLPAYCETITDAEKCIAAFYKGCSFCSGKCVAAAGMQGAVINCVREAYKDADPNKVNGKSATELGGVTVPSVEEILFHSMAGLSELKNVVGGDSAVMSWGIYEDSRNETQRVPIHVHPLGGYTCVNKGSRPVAMEIQGAPTQTFKEGECFNMQANVKMTQAPPHDGYTVTDYFHENGCLPTWVVIETDAYHIQDAQFGVQSDLVCTEKPP